MDRDISYFNSLYNKFIKEVKQRPEGVVEVDLALLHRLGLLKCHVGPDEKLNLTRYFYVVESENRVTLTNEQFTIWISPEKVNNTPMTFTLIALNRPEGPQIETAFSTWGIYNSSQLVLRILEKFLIEIQETEELLSHLKLGT